MANIFEKISSIFKPKDELDEIKDVVGGGVNTRTSTPIPPVGGTRTSTPIGETPKLTFPAAAPVDVSHKDVTTAKPGLITTQAELDSNNKAIADREAQRSKAGLDAISPFVAASQTKAKEEANKITSKKWSAPKPGEAPQLEINEGYVGYKAKEALDNLENDLNTYTPKKGGLALRAMENDQRNGYDWTQGTAREREEYLALMKELDNPAYAKVYKDVEAVINSKDGEKIKQTYSDGYDILTRQLESRASMYGKDSAEYKAAEKALGFYENLGRQAIGMYVNRDVQAVSKQTDEAIESIYSGIVNREDFDEIAKKGEAKMRRDPHHAFMARVENASDLQKNLFYYVYYTDGFDALYDLYNRFLGDTLNYETAASDFLSDIGSGSKAERFWEANKANHLSALAQTFGGIEQTFTNTESDPNDRTLVGDYKISDAVDDYLRRELGQDLSDDDLSTYGQAVFDEMATLVGDEDWYKEALAKGTDYQKQMLGYIALANGSTDVAASLWDAIKQYDDAVWQTVKGSNTIASQRGTLEGALYSDYLGLGGEKNKNGKTSAQVVWDLAQTTRAQYPQMAVNMGLALLGMPGLGRVMGNAVMGASVYGNSYKQSRDEGKEKGASIGYSATQAAMEFGVGMLLDAAGSIPGLLTGGGLKFIEKIANPYLRAIATLGIRGLGEGTEEFIQEGLENPVRNLWFGEENEFEPFSDEALYSFFLGAASAMLMSPGNTVAEMRSNAMMANVGKALNFQKSTEKLLDTVLNNPVESGTKEQLGMYKEAKELAEQIKSGKVKASDLNVGNLLKLYGQAGGDTSFLEQPSTITYTKDQITYDDMVAGAKSVLLDMNADPELAYDIAKLAMGQEISAEAQTKINDSTAAKEVLSQLQGDLDMSQNNALTRAARATTIAGALDRVVYNTIKNENPDKNILSPSMDYLYKEGGLKVKDAEAAGSVIDKVLSGQEITEKEAKLFDASKPGIRASLLKLLDIDVNEYATTADVMKAINAKAKEIASIKDKQAGVKESVKTATRVTPVRRGGIAANGQQGISGATAESNAGSGSRGSAEVSGTETAGAGGVETSRALPADQRQRRLQPRAGTGADQTAEGADGRRRVIPADKLSAEQRSLHQRLVSIGAQIVEFIFGEDSYCGWDSRRGAYVIGIRADGQFSERQYAAHEPVHLWVTEALKPEYRKKVLDAWRAMFGAEFDKAFNQVYNLYKSKGYLDGLSKDEAQYRVVEDILAMSHAGQDYSKNKNAKFLTFDFSKYQDLAKEFIEALGLEAIGSGDITNPAVVEAFKNGLVNEEYYSRHGYQTPGSQAGATEIDISDSLNRSADEEEQHGKGNERGTEETSQVVLAERSGKEEKNRRKTLAFRRTEEQKQISKEAHESAKLAFEEDGSPIVKDSDVPDEYRAVENTIREYYPDANIAYIDDPFLDDYVIFQDHGKGTDAGFFINLALISSGELEKDGYTMESVAKHELAHAYMHYAGINGTKAFLDIFNNANLTREEKAFVRELRDAYFDEYADKLTPDRYAEIVADLFGGRERLYHKMPGLYDKLRPAALSYFQDNADFEPVGDIKNFSADDPGFYQSVGIIMPDGQTASFTDNINAVHEEILNQLNGVEADDAKDIIMQGGIRVKPGVGVEINGDTAPTPAQYSLLDKIVENFEGKEFNIDFNIDGISAGTRTFTGAEIDPDKIYAYLRNYYQRRKTEKANNARLNRYRQILGMPVKTMEDAYKTAKFLMQMEGDDPELQEIIDVYESGRFSADEDILNPESENYLGPDIDARTLEQAQEADVYSNQDTWFRNNEEVEEDADALGSESTLDEDVLEAQLDALLAELDEVDEPDTARRAEILQKYNELQTKAFNKTKNVDEAATPAPKKTAPAKTETKTEPKKTQLKKAKATPKVIPSAKQVAEAAAEEAAPTPTTQAPTASTPEELLNRLNANPELANDLAFQAEVAAAMKQMAERQEAVEGKTEKPEAKAFRPAVEAQKEKTEEPKKEKTKVTIRKKAAPEVKAEVKTETPTEPKKPIVLENDGTVYKKHNKNSQYWKDIGKAESIEIRRRRSDRDTFDVRITDRKGNQVAYEEVSPAALAKAFAVATNDRETAKARAEEAMRLASAPSLEWREFGNPKLDHKTNFVTKHDLYRGTDNYGRTVTAGMTDYMAKSAVRDAKGALLNTYRLADADGVHNAKLPGRLAMFTERPAPMNYMRGLRGAEAYGLGDTSAAEKIKSILTQLGNKDLSSKEINKLRYQLAQIEQKNREYTKGVTRLDPFRPGREAADPRNIVNGKSLLEAYLNIEKPKEIDAQGKGLDFVKSEVQKNIDEMGDNDGFKFTNVRVIPEGESLGGGDLDLDTVYVTTANNQAKSTWNTSPTKSDLMQYSADEYLGEDTGFTDGSLEDTILKILRDKDEDHAAAALAEFAAQFLQTGVLPKMENERTRNIFQPKISESHKQIIQERLDKLVDQYGRIEPGEKPARDVAIPAKTDEGFVRKLYRTAAESKHTPDRAVPYIARDLIQNEAAVYQRMTDKAAVANADREMKRKGFDHMLAEWRGKIDMDANKISKNDVAIGELLYIEAVKAGDMETAMQTLAELAEVGTTAGQVVQAFRMLKNMPKSYQLYYFQRVANRLNRQYAKRINSGKMSEIKIDRKLAQAVLNAKTEEELQKAVDNLIQNIADQIPVTFADKWNAWRYLSMLGNPKTHIRNFFGNSIFAPAKFMKNLIAAGLESTFIKDPSQRVTSYKGLLDRRGTAEYRAFAEKDYEGIKKDLQSGGKYNPSNEIDEKRTIFKSKALEWLRKKNGWALEAEDGMFLHKHYVNALTNFLATKGVSLKTLQSTTDGQKILNAARQYAFIEAQKATYRDASQVATAINALKKVPMIGTLVEGILPFAKTPINILKRGVEYSPVGLLKTIAFESSKLKNGEITANEYIDNLSAGLSGTAIMALGLFLSSLGILHGGKDDDDKTDEFNKLQGYQDYSIDLEIGGKKYNYTIDWAAPSALPLFVGSALYEELNEKNGFNANDLINALMVIAEPITQLSMLSGLNDTLKSAKWDDHPLSSVITSMASGYFSQAIPTVMGQLSRSLTEDRRTTYVDKNSDVPQSIQRWWQTNVMGKTPLNLKRAEYIDAWGRKDTTQGFGIRLIENALSPGYINRIQTTAVDEELERLSKATGSSSVLMSSPERYIEFNKETHHLTAEQYAAYAKTRGDATMSMLTSLFNSFEYQTGMTDEEKAKAVTVIKEYGNILGKQAVFPEYSTDDDNWAEKCDGDTNRLMNMAMLKAKASAQGITAGNNGEFYKLIISSDWLDPTEQGFAIAQQYNTTSDTAYVRKGGPTYALNAERKQEMYKYFRVTFPAYYLELVNSAKWQNATLEKKIDLLADLRKSVGADSKKWLAQQLAERGIPSDG